MKIFSLDIESFNSFWINFHDKGIEPIDKIDLKFRFVFDCFVRTSMNMVKQLLIKTEYFYDFKSVESFFQNDKFQGFICFFN